MNVSQYNIPLRNQILKTYSSGKYGRTLYGKENGKISERISKKGGGVLITISREAKEFYAKARQVAYQHGTPIQKKTNASKSVFEKVNSERETSDIRKTEKRKENVVVNFDEYFDSVEKYGYVISGNISETQEEEKSPSEKLLETFEIEMRREPGRLVNALV